MRDKLRAAIKKGKLKIIDVDGSLIDSVKPFDLDDTLDMLQLKYSGKKKK